jgi:hypothetical protein
MSQRFLLTVFGALLALTFLGACASSHRTGALVSPASLHPAGRITSGMVYGPDGRLVRELDGATAEQVVRLLEQGRPMVVQNVEKLKFAPLSYSVGFSRGTSKKWSVQFFGRAVRVGMPDGTLLSFTRPQRRAILALVDPERRWRY